MRIGFRGQITDERRIRAGFIGCGSHSFRNIYPALQFAPVELVAVCDLRIEKARAFARQFGAQRAYHDYRQMLAEEDLDAVFVVTNYDDHGRPRYPAIAIDCLNARRHVWIEKPPAASCEQIERMRAAAAANGKHVMVGLKKMFAPANVRAKALMEAGDFGQVQLVSLQYPQYTPTADQFNAYRRGARAPEVVSFLDHLCHPVSLMLFLLGMPQELYYRRSAAGAAAATFTFSAGAVAVLNLVHGAGRDGGSATPGSTSWWTTTSASASTPAPTCPTARRPTTTPGPPRPPPPSGSPSSPSGSSTTRACSCSATGARWLTSLTASSRIGRRAKVPWSKPWGSPGSSKPSARVRGGASACKPSRPGAAGPKAARDITYVGPG